MHSLVFYIESKKTKLADLGKTGIKYTTILAVVHGELVQDVSPGKCDKVHPLFQSNEQH